MCSRSEGEAFFPHEGAVSFANAREARNFFFSENRSEGFVECESDMNVFA